MTDDITRRLDAAAERGVMIVDPRQTWIGPDVDLARLDAGCVLYPGTRLHGRNTLLAAGAEVGREGPATLIDTVLDERARVDSGFCQGVVLLRDASAGANAHFRAGTLLEEEASTAHAVGLKQTILLSFVTLGSLINFCDCLMAGGRSREQHSEVGSGFIHFNFTPWGARGDKATPSLVGDVVRGVFLREERIFLGGSGGLVGPTRVGYGSVTAAGQVVRKDVPDQRLQRQESPPVDRALAAGRLDRAQPRGRKNVDYIAQLVALRAWYRQVRLARLPEAAGLRREVLAAAIAVLDGAIVEREKRLAAFLAERERPALRLDLDRELPPCPLAIAPGDADHVAWVRSLGDDEVDAGRAWLQAIADAITAAA